MWGDIFPLGRLWIGWCFSHLYHLDYVMIDFVYFYFFVEFSLTCTIYIPSVPLAPEQAGRQAEHATSLKHQQQQQEQQEKASDSPYKPAPTSTAQCFSAAPPRVTSPLSPKRESRLQCLSERVDA